MTAIRTQLSDVDKMLLTQLLQGDNYVWSLSTLTRLPRETVESSLLKLENAGFLSSCHERNENNVMRKVYSIRPHIKELLKFDPVHVWAVLEKTLRNLKESPESNRDAIFTAAKRAYELSNNVSFASPKGAPLDNVERLVLDPSTQIGKILWPIFSPDRTENQEN